MPRPKELHGAALQNSRYASIATFWLMNNPRLTAGKLRRRLIDKYGSPATFSQPLIRAWMDNYYPELIKEITADVEGGRGGTARSMSSLLDSKLFANVADPLDYHQRMVMLIEDKLKDVEQEYGMIQDRVREINDDSSGHPPSASDEKMSLSAASSKLRDQIIKLSREIRSYKSYMDEWQRVHDYGERMGDLAYSLLEIVVEHVIPEVNPDVRKEVTSGMKDSFLKTLREFKVPADKVYG